jgi:hypothetical protein
MSETARHYCRRCRSKLPAPVENLRNAFCCRGCFQQHYHARCLVCECEMTRTTGNQRLCRRRKCRKDFRALKVHFVLGRYFVPSGVNLIKKTPDFIGPKQPLSPARPWRVVAGPTLSEAELRWVTVAEDATARLNRANRHHRREAGKAALIQHHHAPVNIVGGHKFPTAPKIEIAPQRRADIRLIPDPPSVNDATASSRLRRRRSFGTDGLTVASGL